MIDPDNHWEVSIIDFDNSQRSWYMIDLGTMLFDLEMTMYQDLGIYMNPAVSQQAAETWFNQFKTWVTDAYGETYGSPVVPEELTQGCEWRGEFMYTLIKYIKLVTPPGDARKWMKGYCNMYENGTLPSC